MGQKFVQSDYPTQSGSLYPANIDANIKVMARLAASYNPCAEDTPSALKVVVQAGAMFVNGALAANASQIVTLAVAHATLPRIDRVVIDALTGVASKIDGVANASPVAPAITAGKLPIAQVLVTATMTIVGNSAITDERASFNTQEFAGRVVVYKTAVQTLTTGSSTTLTWDAEEVDTDSMHDNVTNNSRLTVPSGFVGFAKALLSVDFISNATGNRAIGINTPYNRYQATQSLAAQASPDNTYGQCATRWVPVTGSEIFTATALQRSGGNLDVNNGNNTTFSLELRR
jgi:hypothetical protein